MTAVSRPETAILLLLSADGFFDPFWPLILPMDEHPFFYLQSHNLSSALLYLPSEATHFSTVTFYWMFNILVYLDKISF